VDFWEFFFSNFGTFGENLGIFAKNLGFLGIFG